MEEVASGTEHQRQMESLASDKKPTDEQSPAAEARTTSDKVRRGLYLITLLEDFA